MKNFNLLYEYLIAMDNSISSVILPLNEIERISQEKLCYSARRHLRLYWLDGRKSPVFRTIHDAGFRIVSNDSYNESIQLERISESGYTGEFCFHGVGQGLFYSGILRNDKDNLFSFVYDCGSTSKLNCSASITEFKKKLEMNADGRMHLDLLVISHFHADHVRGLPELLENMDVDTVVFPYSDPDLLKLEILDCTDPELEDLFEYGPVAWFENKGVKRIITNHIEETDKEYSNREMSEESRLVVDGNSIREVQGNIILARNRTSTAVGKNLWSFDFDFRTISNKTQKATMQKVKEFLQIYPIEEIIRSNGISTVIRNKLGASLLSNDSSVLMMHKPTKVKSMECVHDGNYVYTENLINSVTLLTGDIDSSRYSYHLLETIYRDYDLDGYHNIVLFPHHGSKHNSLNKFKRLKHADIVVSHGIKNRYGHPSKEVKANLTFKSVDDNSSFYYKLNT